MGKRKYFQDSAEIADVKEENDDELVVRAAAAREMVQDYGRYKALKPAKAIDRAKRTVEAGAYLTDGHPPEGVVTNQDEIIGKVRNPEYDEKASKLMVDLAFDKSNTKPKVLEEIKDGERTDVSIGFYADEIMEDGKHNGKEYDRKQMNIVIDHVASLSPDSMGRCSSEDGCGIVENMDRIASEQVINEADPSNVDEGNKVRGNSANGPWYGVVDVKETDGTVSSNIGEQTMEGTEDNPAFRVELYDYKEDNNRWEGRDEYVVHRAGAMTVISSFPEGGRDSINVANFAGDSQEVIEEAVQDLRDKGFSAKVRECSCGDHHGHVEVDQIDMEELEDRDTRNAIEVVDRNREEPKFEWGRITDKFGPSTMPSEEKQDKFIREAEENKDVDTMGDQDNQPDVTEDQLEELRNKANKADELEEKRAEELRDRLVEKYGVDEDKVEDMKVDELERFEDTLDASDLVQDEDDEDADEDEGEVVDTRTGPEGEGDDDILQHEKTNDKGLIAADTNSFTGKA